MFPVTPCRYHLIADGVHRFSQKVDAFGCFFAAELRRQGVCVRSYHEETNKHVKICSWLLKWWPRVVLIEGTDPAWLNQILDYTEYAAHDDAPDSAASLLRALDRRQDTSP